MNILVLIKEVPDMEKVKFDSEKGVVDRSSAQAEINPFDLNALQTAVQLKNGIGAKVTVITMGPPGAEKSLRDAYARGADECILLSDRKFGGSDTLSTSRTIASAIRKIKDFDIIICGEKSVDGDTAQVGAEVAEVLDIPHAYYVEKINSLTGNEVNVTIENLCASKQHRSMGLPALLSVTKNISHPELPELKRKLESLEVDIKKITLADLEGYITEEETGIKGSPTKVQKIEVPGEILKENRIYSDEIHFIKDFLEAVKNTNTL